MAELERESYRVGPKIPIDCLKLAQLWGQPGHFYASVSQGPWDSTRGKLAAVGALGVASPEHAPDYE